MNPRAAHDTEHLRRINSLLEVGLALPPDAREAWLQALPAEQRALVPLLRALLSRSAVASDSFMRAPAALALALEDDDAATARPDQAGDLVGPYRPR